MLPPNVERDLWADNIRILCKSRRIKLPSDSEWRRLLDHWEPETPSQGGVDELLYLRTQRIH